MHDVDKIINAFTLNETSAPNADVLIRQPKMKTRQPKIKEEPEKIRIDMLDDHVTCPRLGEFALYVIRAQNKIPQKHLMPCCKSTALLYAKAKPHLWKSVFAEKTLPKPMEKIRVIKESMLHLLHGNTPSLKVKLIDKKAVTENDPADIFELHAPSTSSLMQ